MADPVILDYRTDHDGQLCRLLVHRSGSAEMRRDTSLRRGLLTWVELRELDTALRRLGLHALPRYHDGGDPTGITCSLRYMEHDVRVSHCPSRDLWKQFPMLRALEEFVVRLNGWPGEQLPRTPRVAA